MASHHKLCLLSKLPVASDIPGLAYSKLIQHRSRHVNVCCSDLIQKAARLG